MNIYHVTREYQGLAGAGGVKDVVRGLAEAACKQGETVVIYLPFYGFLKKQWEDEPLFPLTPLSPWDLPLPGMPRVQLHRGVMGGIEFRLIEAPCFTDKAGVYTYNALDEKPEEGRARGRGHRDSQVMNLTLIRAVLEDLSREKHPFGLIHCHDGHAALLPLVMECNPCLKKRLNPGPEGMSVLTTIHNAGPGYHQETNDLALIYRYTGVEPSLLRESTIEGRVDPFLAAGIHGTLNTVSPQYAREILEDVDRQSQGLGPALEARGIHLVGITNGIDDPGEALPSEQEKKAARETLRRGADQWVTNRRYGRWGSEEEGPLLALQSRITHQKGIGLLAEALEGLIQEYPEISFRFCAMGQGVPEEEEKLIRLCHQFPQRPLLYLQGYEESLVEDLLKGSHFFLIPSLFEPCGLTDLMAQSQGSLPLVHLVGGLQKVLPDETGFGFSPGDPDSLKNLLVKVLSQVAAEEEPFSSAGVLSQMRERAFQVLKENYTWHKVYRKGYRPLYLRVIEGNALEPF